jgi:hypothetical protein
MCGIFGQVSLSKVNKDWLNKLRRKKEQHTKTNIKYYKGIIDRYKE